MIKRYANQIGIGVLIMVPMSISLYGFLLLAFATKLDAQNMGTATVVLYLPFVANQANATNVTPTSTSTDTATATPPSTATNTATSTPTQTPTSTNSATETAAPIQTSIPSSTATNTVTNTATSTLTPTNTTTDTATPSVTPTATSTHTPTPMSNMDDESDQWQIYVENAPVPWLGGVAVPSLDGKALRCSILGGQAYSNVQCYRNLPAVALANRFDLSVAFWISATTTCNNQGGTSVVQALEFTMSKWLQAQRYEIALQWQNVGQTPNDGAPQWRYWDPNTSAKWQPLSPKISACLTSKTWHRLRLQGAIVKGQVSYDSFTLDDQKYELNLIVQPIPAPMSPDRLAIAIQLDGNANETPYDVVIDQVNFTVLP